MPRYSLALFLVSAVSLATAADAPSLIRVDSARITIAHQVEVPALETGIIGRLNVKEGELIEEGQLLGILDDVDAKLALSRAEIEAAIAEETAKNDVNIRAAQNGNETSKTELARAQEAVDKFKKSISQTEIDRLKLAVDQTTLAIEQAQVTQRTAQLQANLKNSELAIAKRKLERHQIRSRVIGRVIEINKQAGEWIEPGKTVLKIARLDRLRCTGFVSATALASDPTGQSVSIKVALADNKSVSVTGKIVFVASDVSVKNDIEVWAEFDNRDRLIRPGMTAEMVIQPVEKLATTK